MKRLLLPLLGAGLLSLNACSSETKTSDTAATGSTVPENSATNSASMTAPNDTAKSGMMAPGDSAKSGAMAAGITGPTAPHANDAEFMNSAAHSDRNEMQLSKLALSKGVTGMTKTYATKMIADHTKSTANLKPIAAAAKVTLPTDMDAEHKQIATQMEKLSGKEFETKYVAQMVTDHQKTANTLRAHEQMTKSGPLRSWIATTLPVVEEHLGMANKDSNMKM